MVFQGQVKTRNGMETSLGLHYTSFPCDGESLILVNACASDAFELSCSSWKDELSATMSTRPGHLTPDTRLFFFFFLFVVVPLARSRRRGSTRTALLARVFARVMYLQPIRAHVHSPSRSILYPLGPSGWCCDSSHQRTPGANGVCLPLMERYITESNYRYVESNGS